MADEYLRDALLLREVDDGAHRVRTFYYVDFRAKFASQFQILLDGLLRFPRSLALPHIDGQQLPMETLRRPRGGLAGRRSGWPSWS